MIGAKINRMNPKIANTNAERIVVVVVAAAAPAGPEHEAQEEVGEQRDDPDHRDRERHHEDVVVADVAQLVREHAFELDPVHLLEQPGGDRDRRVLRVAAGRERVRRGIVDDVEARLRQPARDAQPLDEVVIAGVLAPDRRASRARSRSATLSLLKYETNDETITMTATITRPTTPPLQQVVEREPDERTATARSTKMSRTVLRLFAAICSYTESLETT